MDKNLEKEIKLLKQEIFSQKEKLTNIKQLVKKEIDRDFPIDLWELSERELDNEMGSRLSFLNDDIDIRPDPGSVTSHRKILGRFVVFFKKILMKISNMYTHTILEKQKRFNEQLVAFHLASFIRFRHNELRIKEIEAKLKVLEEDQDILLEHVNELKDKGQKNNH